jgi:hypothetical protein
MLYVLLVHDYRTLLFPVIPIFAVFVPLMFRGANIQTCWDLFQKPAFPHRLLCVAMSLARISNNIKFFNKQAASQGPVLKDSRVVTQNVVYPEVFYE